MIRYISKREPAKYFFLQSIFAHIVRFSDCNKFFKSSRHKLYLTSDAYKCINLYQFVFVFMLLSRKQLTYETKTFSASRITCNVSNNFVRRKKLTLCLYSKWKSTLTF